MLLHPTVPPGSYRRDSESTDGRRADPRLGGLGGYNTEVLEATLSSEATIHAARSQASGGDGKVGARNLNLTNPDSNSRTWMEEQVREFRKAWASYPA